MLEKLVNIFFPRTCPICGEVIEGNNICSKCTEKVKIIREPRCEKCGKPLISGEKIYCRDCNEKAHEFDKGVAVFEYSGELMESIYRFKYGNAREYADFYGDVATKIYGKTLRNWKINAIIPVPLHNKKELKRGYNQAQVFADKISKNINVVMDTKCLIRRDATIPQKELSDEMRRNNVKNAFAVDCEKTSGYDSVLLVDDIYTTGSTLDACAKVLKASGVKSVYFLCISIGKK